MPTETVLELVNNALKVALIISAPMLLTALVVGILISLFQAVTQIQEMTLTFIPKILATVFVLMLTLGWMIQTIIEYIRELFDAMPGLIN